MRCALPPNDKDSVSTRTQSHRRADDVRRALAEDVGAGDLTARLVPGERAAHARVITREAGVFCGRPWVNATFDQIDAGLKVTWHVEDGDHITPEQVLFELSGPARAILTGNGPR